MQHWAAAVNKPWSKAAATPRLVCSQQKHCLPDKVHFRQQTDFGATVSSRTSSKGKAACE